jgi:hypothetical protein
MPSDFMSDRLDDFDAPSDESPLREKLEWQRKLEAQRLNAELPSDLPHVDINETRWWRIPFCPSPEQLAHQNRRYLKRIMSDDK